MLIWIFLLLALVVLVVTRLPNFRKRRQLKSVKVMSVLGSGGHTGEMMPLIDSMTKRKHYTKFVFIASEGDSLSLSHPLIPPNSIIETIPRARRVGQSLLTSPFTTIYSILRSIKLILHKPDVLIVNGPGVCLPVVLVMFVANVLRITDCNIVFVESVCRVKSLSLTGKMIYPLCDLFFVHWNSLVKGKAQRIDLYGAEKAKTD